MDDDVERFIGRFHRRAGGQVVQLWRRFFRPHPRRFALSLSLLHRVQHPSRYEVLSNCIAQLYLIG